MIRPFLAALLLATPALAEDYVVDIHHSEIRYYWSHAGVSELSGQWRDFEGRVAFDADDIAATEVAFTIRAAGLDSGMEEMDEILLGEDMFDAEAHPEITFVSTAVEQTGPETARLTGDLTMRGETRPVTLDLTLVHIGEHPMAPLAEFYEGEWIGARAEGVIRRSEWGLGFGLPVIPDEVRIEAVMELKAE